ncbi:unnamed protein product [Allacma fusca]|uniref:Farnesoic acid O-methyl transferase domain-containing protein n=1 Tax=Allacma fusca TaxID=39272 RepID=A0A8J2PTW2_9HEXA|nr:unnamed protein product [Allacma fusca]
MGFLFLSFLATTYSETTDPSIPSPTFELYCDKHCPCTVGKPKFIEFPHESCQIRNLTGHYFLPCYKILNHSQDRIEVFVKFRGEADGHVRLTDTNDKGFDIIIGSFTNKRTEIRRNYIDETDLRTKHIIETPGVLSSKEFRSFLIRYDKNTTKIELLMEGKSEPLLTWVDWKDHFDLRYVSFSGYNSQLKLEVAFNCTIKDETSVIYELKSLNYTDHQIYYNNGREIYISKKNILLESNLTQDHTISGIIT